MDKRTLGKILREHKKWLDSNKTEGSRASLVGKDLSAADLRGADMDYSSWPLWCGSLNVKIDKRLACQLLYHTIRAMQSVDDAECIDVCNDPKVLRLANKFKPVCGSCPKLKRTSTKKAEKGTSSSPKQRKQK